MGDWVNVGIEVVSHTSGLLAFAGGDGCLFLHGDAGVAGRGTALRLDVKWVPGDLGGSLEEIADMLDGLRSKASATPVAFVAIPFTDSSAITAVVPSYVLRTRGPESEMVTISGSKEASESKPFLSAHASSFDVRPSRHPEEWSGAVKDAIARITAGELDKVVLAREVVVEADAPFDAAAILRNLNRAYPSAYCFAIDGFVGASPELLIERNGPSIRSLPLAGTFPRSNDPDEDALLSRQLLESTKDRTEHHFLSEMVSEALRPYCRHLEVPEVPEVLSLANVHHLATPISGELRSSETGVLELVARLHPTPAVGGRPTEAAVDLIAELENLDRGRYAGAVGWVDADGNGCFAVAIRCAQLEGNRASVIAGGGIVASSSPEVELEETQWKLQAMLSALIRP